MSQLMRFIRGEDDDLDEQELSAKKSANLLLWLILAFFVVFIAWAALTQLDRTVRGVGRVVPSSKLQVVSNLEGGVVEQILVKPGQTVRKGDILVRLSPMLTGAALGSSSAEVDALQAKIARLNAEVRGVTPSYGAGAADQVAVERSLHSARSAELQGILAAGAARAAQAERQVAEAQSLLESRRSSLSAADRELAMIRPMADKLIISKVDLIKAENAATVARNEVDAANAALARARSAIAEARAQTAQQRSDWMSRAGMELSQAQGELVTKQQQLPALSDRVDRTTIRAPMSGKVNRVLVTTVGGSVGPGTPIAEIVPSEQTLYVEALIRPSDIANVRLGQRARVEVTAYNSAIFGMLDGTVTAISPDATLNEKSGESFYTVEVQTASTLRDQDGRSLPIGPGMVANVSLLGEKRSILNYLFTPITRLGETAFRE
ncbi:HlyD family type I secretion periplasmic adaptor subunit [Novosphingobium sp. Gsoil 351]|uniref:HlyD family type I secretion periplasmic adaptor subunit n=1 Tax=Novosphingobium sp. Gsoil 351 TaxID=2675225 RepID=UPI001E39E29F|nr:HlyD family type I secretion periplasmic adaptor subunit [Novosphingobium sp. Gsoil 351]